MVMSLSRVLWKVRSKVPTVTASVQGTVSVAGEGYTTIRDSTFRGLWSRSCEAGQWELVLPGLVSDDAADDDDSRGDRGDDQDQAGGLGPALQGGLHGSADFDDRIHCASPFLVGWVHQQ